MIKKYRIGITFNLETKNPDIWANGVSQNIIFLYDLFKHSEIVEDVILVSWGPEKRTSPPDGFMLDREDLQFDYIDNVIDELDVLIEGTLIIEPHHAERMRKHGGKIVAYKMGNDFIMDQQAVVTNTDKTVMFNGTVFDSVWITPQFENSCFSYFSIMYRSPAYIVPAIWDSRFCDKVIKRIKDEHNITFGYKANLDTNEKARRVSTFEPNIFVVKTSFTPILICEQAYRQNPEALKHVYMCNTYDKKDHPVFFNFIGRTELVKNHIMTVEGRYQMPDFLSRYTDIVLSHHWENGLNYAYNDALYGGYPLVHNSTFLPKGVGYYYDQFDAFEGANVLLNVIENHDKHHDEYVKRANEYLESLHPLNPVNMYRYEKEIKRLFE
ncbi:DUF2827 family protein [Pasteurellaceae bacterium LIM206]|nr:DUF2827 family protein [Pasteurellaceae bacterium LIM206]